MNHNTNILHNIQSENLLKQLLITKTDANESVQAQTAGQNNQEEFLDQTKLNDFQQFTNGISKCSFLNKMEEDIEIEYQNIIKTNELETDTTLISNGIIHAETQSVEDKINPQDFSSMENDSFSDTFIIEAHSVDSKISLEEDFSSVENEENSVDSSSIVETPSVHSKINPDEEFSLIEKEINSKDSSFIVKPQLVKSKINPEEDFSSIENEEYSADSFIVETQSVNGKINSDKDFASIETEINSENCPFIAEPQLVKSKINPEEDFSSTENEKYSVDSSFIVEAQSVNGKINLDKDFTSIEKEINSNDISFITESQSMESKINPEGDFSSIENEEYSAGSSSVVDVPAVNDTINSDKDMSSVEKEINLEDSSFINESQSMESKINPEGDFCSIENEEYSADSSSVVEAPAVNDKINSDKDMSSVEKEINLEDSSFIPELQSVDGNMNLSENFSSIEQEINSKESSCIVEPQSVENKINPEEEFSLVENEKVNDNESTDPLQETSHSELESSVEIPINYMCYKCGKFFSSTNESNHCSLTDEALSVMKIFPCNHCKETFLREDLLEDHMFVHSSSQYICDRCGTSYVRQEDLVTHERIHDNNKCLECLEIFIDKNEMDLHYKKLETFMHCSPCDAYFWVKCAYNRHLRTHSVFRAYVEMKKSKSSFKCDQCNQVFNSTNELLDHCRTHSEVRPILCEYCGTSYVNIYNLRRHLKKNTISLTSRSNRSLSPFPCDKCNEAFMAKCSLKKHVLAMHTENSTSDQNIRNPVIEKKPAKIQSNINFEHPIKNDVRSLRPRIRFTNDDKQNSQLQNTTVQYSNESQVNIRSNECPVENVHNTSTSQLLNNSRLLRMAGVGSYCDICNSKFTTNFSLKMHARSVHKNTSLFTCNVCKKLFLLEENFKNHYNEHGIQKQPKYICSKSSFNKPNVKRNQIIRNRKKVISKPNILTYEELMSKTKKFHYPLKCEFCSMSFNYKRMYVEHYLKHTGEKPFACNICGMRFIRERNMRTHLKVHRKKNKFPNAMVQKHEKKLNKAVVKNNEKIWNEAIILKDEEVFSETIMPKDEKILNEAITQINEKTLNEDISLNDEKIFNEAMQKDEIRLKDELLNNFHDISRRTRSNNYNEIQQINFKGFDDKFSDTNSIGSISSFTRTTYSIRRDITITSSKVSADTAESFKVQPYVTLNPLDKTVLEKSVYVCDICDKFFLRSISLNGHKKMCSFLKRKRLNSITCEKMNEKQLMLKSSNPPQLINNVKQTVQYSNNKIFMEIPGLQYRVVVRNKKKYFVCEKCNKYFKRKNCLIEHSHKHTGMKPYPCDLCSSSFTRKSNLRRHIAHRHSTLTPENFNSETTYNNVLNNFEVEEKFTDLTMNEMLFENEQENTTSLALNQMFQNKQIQKTVITEMESETQVELDYDQIDIFEPQCIVKDEKLDTEETFYDCKIENTSVNHFLELITLENDTNNENQNEDIIDRKSIENIIISENEDVIPESQFVCAQCNCGFNRREDLIRHYSVHDSEAFVCFYCKKKFASRKYLTRHAFIHKRKKTHTCAFCQKSYRTNSELINHYRVHTGEKPFECDQCGKRFRINQHLTVHYRIHTGEKPYICTNCSVSFSRTETLWKHMRNCRSQNGLSGGIAHNETISID